MIVFFRWLASVYDDAGLRRVGDWARSQASFAEQWRYAFAGWWLTRFVLAPTSWASAFLARHEYVAVGGSVLWVVTGVAVWWYLGVDGVATLIRIQPVGLVGDGSVFVAYCAVLVLTLRVGGNRLLRPVKAAIIVAATFGLFWAGTAATYRYAYGVEIWSRDQWRLIAEWWYDDRNFAWSAVFVGLGWFTVWVVGLVLVAIRAARVWLAMRKWGIWIMLWAVRLVIFASVVFFIASWLGTAPVDVLVSYSAAIESVPYIGGFLGEASPWPLLIVGAVFGSICVFLFAVTMGTVADVFSLVGKLLAIVYHGGVLFADRVEPKKPVRLVGLEVLVVRWDEVWARRRKEADAAYDERAGERLRRRAEREALSDMGPDGFTLFDPVPVGPAVARGPV